MPLPPSLDSRLRGGRLMTAPLSSKRITYYANIMTSLAISWMTVNEHHQDHHVAPADQLGYDHATLISNEMTRQMPILLTKTTTTTVIIVTSILSMNTIKNIRLPPPEQLGHHQLVPPPSETIPSYDADNYGDTVDLFDLQQTLSSHNDEGNDGSDTNLISLGEPESLWHTKQ